MRSRRGRGGGGGEEGEEELEGWWARGGEEGLQLQIMICANMVDRKQINTT